MKISLKKEDYKRFKKCFKIAWALANRENLDYVCKWVENKDISIHKFSLQDNVNSSKIEDIDFIEDEDNETTFLSANSYDFALETYWVSEANDDLNYVLKKQGEDVLEKQTISKETIDFYPGETIADGNETGAKAREYFMRNYRYFNLDLYSKRIAFAKTKEVLADPSYDVYFEPSFVYNDCLTKCDILKKLPDGTYHLIEVKASTGRKYDNVLGEYVDKKIKDEYGYDVAYQYYVLTGNGLEISKISLMLLNSEYYKDGDIDYDELFLFQDFYKFKTKKLAAISLLEFCQQTITGVFAKRVNKNRQITLDIAMIKTLFKKSPSEILEYFTQSHCLNNNGDKNGYCKHVTKYLPEHHSIFELTRGMEKKTLLLYQENIEMLKDIILPFTFKLATAKKPINFNVKQQRQILTVQDLTTIVEPSSIEAIKKILEKYQYPIYMYDFETMKSAIPRFDYAYSYQQIPFQYSVHIIKDDNSDYNDETTISHSAYLSDGESDPRIELVQKLTTDLYQAGPGIYVAYYKSFEQKVLFELEAYLQNIIADSTEKITIKKYQELKFKIHEIAINTIDLMDFFKDFMIYKKEFYGSISIKKTQPAFDNNFTYYSLQIQKGDMASEVFRRRVENNISLSIWLKYFRTPMLEYCKRDTLAMVVIYQHVKKLMEKY